MLNVVYTALKTANIHFLLVRGGVRKVGVRERERKKEWGEGKEKCICVFKLTGHMSGERKTGSKCHTFVGRLCDYNEHYLPQVLFQLSRCPHSMPRVDLCPLSMARVDLCPPRVDLCPRSMPRVDLCPPRVDLCPRSMPRVDLCPPRVDLCLPLVHQTFSMDHKVRGQMENFLTSVTLDHCDFQLRQYF